MLSYSGLERCVGKWAIRFPSAYQEHVRATERGSESCGAFSGLIFTNAWQFHSSGFHLIGWEVEREGNHVLFVTGIQQIPS